MPERLKETSILCLPLGAIEQHGPHLPLNTDVIIAEELTRRIVARWGAELDLWQLPTVPIGLSREHDWAPGTLSLSVETFAALIRAMARDIVRALPARNLAIINGHGGNRGILDNLIHELSGDFGLNVCVVHPFDLSKAETDTGIADVHGGRSETSVMLALTPQLVRRNRIAAGTPLPRPGAVEALIFDRGVSFAWRTDDPRLTATGAIGDAHGASPRARTCDHRQRGGGNGRGSRAPVGEPAPAFANRETVMSIETRVSSHYAHGDLLNAIDAALLKAGKNPAGPTLEDLAPIDEFHVRGREATKELGAGLGLRQDHLVLDVGSGLGGPSRQLAMTYRCRITGIDLTEEYCRVATELASRVGLSDRVRYRQGSALAMPFPDASFDLAYTQHVAMNIADKAGLYREIARVLKPRGKLGIYDLLQGQGGSVHFPVPWAHDESTSFLAGPDDMRSLLSDAGFEIANWSDTSEIGKEWFKALNRRLVETGLPPLGFHVLLGADFAAMAKNQVRNLIEDRIRPTEIICVKRL